MRTVPLTEAQTRLADLIDEATAGGDVTISRGDGSSVRLVPVAGGRVRPTFGSARGEVEMSDDFDAPVDGFEPYAP